MAEQHVEEQLAAYALGALDRSEAVEVAAHLNSCAHCRAALEDYEAVASQLAYAPPPQEPPALKDALLERVRPPRTPVPGAPKAASAPALKSHRDWLAPLRQILRPAWVVALLLILLAAGNVALWRTVQEARQQPSDFATVPLTGTNTAPQATGLIVISDDGQHGTLVVQNLPLLEGEQQYQLWLLHDGERDDGGVFSVSGNGYASHYVRSPRALADYTSFGITIEPAGGSDGPTGERVLAGSR